MIRTAALLLSLTALACGQGAPTTPVLEAPTTQQEQPVRLAGAGRPTSARTCVQSSVFVRSDVDIELNALNAATPGLLKALNDLGLSAYQGYGGTMVILRVPSISQLWDRNAVPRTTPDATSLGSTPPAQRLAKYLFDNALPASSEVDKTYDPSAPITQRSSPMGLFVCSRLDAHTPSPYYDCMILGDVLQTYSEVSNACPP